MFDPNSDPNYFVTSAFYGGGNPRNWELATVAVVALCAVAIWVLGRRQNSPGIGVLVGLTPALLGCVFTVFQLHALFDEFGKEWMGSHRNFRGRSVVLVVFGASRMLRIYHSVGAFSSCSRQDGILGEVGGDDGEPGGMATPVR